MTMSKGDKVAWDWGNGTATGKVTDLQKGSITRTIKGSEVTRNGSSDDPALDIEQDDGDRVLKLASEVRNARCVIDGNGRSWEPIPAYGVWNANKTVLLRGLSSYRSQP